MQRENFHFALCCGAKINEEKLFGSESFSCHAALLFSWIPHDFINFTLYGLKSLLHTLTEFFATLCKISFFSPFSCSVVHFVKILFAFALLQLMGISSLVCISPFLFFFVQTTLVVWSTTHNSKVFLSLSYPHRALGNYVLSYSFTLVVLLFVTMAGGWHWMCCVCAACCFTSMHTSAAVYFVK